MSINRTVPIIILSIALLVAVYLPCGNAAALLIMDETFDSAIPAGWTQVQYSGTGLWQWSNDTITNYEPLNYEGGFLSADSDTCSHDVYDVGLFTPSMNMTGLTSVQIAFDKNFQSFSGDEASVATYSGGTGVGNLEEQLGFWDADDPPEGEHVSYMIDPSTYADPSDVYVEFWYSSGGGTWKWSFSIDNLLIEGEGTVGYDTPWSPVIMQPLVTTNLGKANALWQCIEPYFSECDDAEVLAMMEQVQAHMQLATSIGNPIAASGALSQALEIMDELAVRLACPCASQ
jgi:hypothetical protein